MRQQNASQKVDKCKFGLKENCTALRDALYCLPRLQKHVLENLQLSAYVADQLLSVCRYVFAAISAHAAGVGVAICKKIQKRLEIFLHSVLKQAFAVNNTGDQDLAR